MKIREKSGKKFLKILPLCIALCISVFLPAYAAQSASVTLNAATPECTGATVVSTQATSSELATHLLKTGWKLTPGKSLNGIVIDIGDDLTNTLPGGSTVDVTVTYYDKTGSFGIMYDSEDNYRKWAGSVKTTGSSSWKTQTFHLERPKFAGRLDGGDIELTAEHTLLSNSKDVVIHSINVTVSDTVTPVKIDITSKNTGNIFFGNSSASFDIEFENITGETELITAKVTAEDENGEVVYSDISGINLDGGAKITKNYKIEDLEYGVYTLYTEVTSNGNTKRKSTASKRFSKVNTAYGEAKNNKFGYSVHFSQTGYDYKKSSELVRNTGAAVLRDSFGWSEFETAADKYTFRPLWTNMLAEAKNNDQEYFLILGSDNRWRHSNQYDDLYLSTETSRNQFKVYVQKLLEEVGDDVRYFEVWNEYNIKNPDVEAYYNLLKVTYETIKDIKPNAIVVAGAVANQYSEEEGRYTVPYDYLTELFNLGAGNYMDVLSIHPYTVPDSAESGTLEKTCNKTRTLAHSYNPNIDVWASEYGWYTRGGSLAKTEKEQAEYAVRTIVMNQAKGFLDKFIWYTFQDESVNLNDTEHSWGMINSTEDVYGAQNDPYAAKASYAAVSSTNKILSGAKCQEDLSNESSGRYVYKFKDDFGRNIYAMWNINGSESYTLTTDNPSMILTDMYGNEESVKNENCSYTLSIGTSPVFLCDATDGAIYGEQGILRISGYVPGLRANVNVGMTVVYPNGDPNDISTFMFADQQKTNADGRYTFDMIPDVKAGQYDVYISDELTGSLVTYSFELTDGIYAEYEEKTEGKTLKVKAVLKSSDGATYDSDISAIIAVYNGNELVRVGVEDEYTQTDGNTREYNLEIPIDSKFTGAKVFIWDDDLKPIVVDYDVKSMSK